MLVLGGGGGVEGVAEGGGFRLEAGHVGLGRVQLRRPSLLVGGSEDEGVVLALERCQLGACLAEVVADRGVGFHIDYLLGGGGGAGADVNDGRRELDDLVLLFLLAQFPFQDLDGRLPDIDPPLLIVGLASQLVDELLVVGAAELQTAVGGLDGLPVADVGQVVADGLDDLRAGEAGGGGVVDGGFGEASGGVGAGGEGVDDRGDVAAVGEEVSTGLFEGGVC